MKPVTRRQFLATAGAGVAGAAALGGRAGCAATAKGDFMPKAGRRVVVVGGGWSGASAAKYVRLEQDRRNPGDLALGGLKALMRTIPDSTYVDLAAYYSSVR